jgi:hypothetical protein
MLPEDSIVALAHVFKQFKQDEDWVNKYLTKTLGEAFVKHEQYQNIITIYGSKSGYEKICSLKDTIVETLKTKWPHVLVRILRA